MKVDCAILRDFKNPSREFRVAQAKRGDLPIGAMECVGGAFLCVKFGNVQPGREVVRHGLEKTPEETVPGECGTALQLRDKLRRVDIVERRGNALSSL